MKKVLLVAAMLIIAAPVLATVTVTATDQGSGVVEVSYNCSAAEKVRAFALDITVDNGLVINDIRDFNRGESKAPGGGYGIFPGNFANYINASSPNWADTNYSPIGRSTDPNTKSGLGTGAITVELGTLYVDGNAPGTSGLLFRLDINGNGTHDGNLSIALNGTRGGIVTEDANLAPSPVLTGTKVTFCTAIPSIVGLTTAAANSAITGAGLTVGTATGQYSCTVAATVVISQDTGSCVGSGTPVNYTYSLGTPLVPNEVNVPLATAEAAITAAGLTYTVAASVNSNTIAYGNVISTSPVAGTQTCSSVTITPSAGCFPLTDPNYSSWVSLGKPHCWCFPRQCHGDADGLAQGTSKLGYYYVGENDLAILVKGWKVLEPPKGPGIQGEPNICADFAHDVQGTSKLGYYRVGENDLARLVQYWKVLESPKGTGTPADCGGTLNP